MNIETLQIKRVTGNWDKHKTYVPKKGEPVFIDSNVISLYIQSPTIPETLCIPVLVFGDGIRTLEAIVEAKEYFIDKKSVDDLISDNIANRTYLHQNEESFRPPWVNGEKGNAGISEYFANFDHTHYLPKSAIDKALSMESPETNSEEGKKALLALNDFKCRRVRAGTDNPPPKALTGDIYIKYESPPSK